LSDFDGNVFFDRLGFDHGEGLAEWCLVAWGEGCAADEFAGWGGALEACGAGEYDGFACGACGYFADSEGGFNTYESFAGEFSDADLSDVGAASDELEADICLCGACGEEFEWSLEAFFSAYAEACDSGCLQGAGSGGSNGLDAAGDCGGCEGEAGDGCGDGAAFCGCDAAYEGEVGLGSACFFEGDESALFCA
jgi:hypothetical protein